MAGIRRETQRTQTLTVIGNAPAIPVRFDKIAGESPNILQIRNLGTIDLVIGRKHTLNINTDVYARVGGNGGVIVITEPLGFIEIFVFTTANTNIEIHSFITDEVTPQNLFQMQPITINNTQTAGNVDVISFPPRERNPETSTIAIINMPLANTEYSLVLPPNTKKIFGNIRQGDNAFHWRLSYVTDRVATPIEPFLRIEGTQNYFVENINIPAGTIFIACSTVARIVQFELWS